MSGGICLGGNVRNRSGDIPHGDYAPLEQEAQLSQRGRAMLRVYQQSASTYLQRSFLLLITAASHLLLHKILLNSILLSPIVSGGVRPKFPRQTPLGHNPPCFLPFVGRLGSGPRLVGPIGSGVPVSISFQQKIPAGFCPTMSYGSPKGGYDQWG